MKEEKRGVIFAGFQVPNFFEQRLLVRLTVVRGAHPKTVMIEAIQRLRQKYRAMATSLTESLLNQQKDRIAKHIILIQQTKEANETKRVYNIQYESLDEAVLDSTFEALQYNEISTSEKQTTKDDNSGSPIVNITIDAGLKQSTQQQYL